VSVLDRPIASLLIACIIAILVAVPKLVSVGPSVQSAELRSRDALLRASAASLSSPQRIERVAARMGIVITVPRRAIPGRRRLQPAAARQSVGGGLR